MRETSSSFLSPKLGMDGMETVRSAEDKPWPLIVIAKFGQPEAISEDGMIWYGMGNDMECQ